METIKTTASHLPTKQKVFLFFLLSAYCGISIFSTIKVFFKFSDIDDDISDFVDKFKKRFLKKTVKNAMVFLLHF